MEAPLPPMEPPTTLELPQVKDPSMFDGASVDIVKVIRKLHDSLSDQITSLAKQVQRLHEKEQPSQFHKDPPVCRRSLSASSDGSIPLRSASHQSKRSSAGANSLALEAFELDMNHLVPKIRRTKKTPVKGEASTSSREFRGKDSKEGRKKEFRKKKHEDATPSMLGLVPVVPTLEGLAQQSLEPELPGNPLNPSVHSSQSRYGLVGPSNESDFHRHITDEDAPEALMAETLQDAPDASDRVGSELRELKPLAVAEDSESPTTSKRNTTTEVSLSALPKPYSPQPSRSSVEVNQYQNEVEASPGHKVSKEGSGNAMSHKASLPSSGSRRRSQANFEFSRVISTGHLTEVFKLKENELTADLKSPSRPSSQRAIKPAIPEVLTPLGCAQNGATDDASNGEEEDATEEIEERSLQCIAVALKFSFLSDFLVSYASKALGLIPIFPAANEDSENPRFNRWPRCIGHGLSRVYHWFLIAVLFFGIATAAHALRICHSQDELAEDLCLGWPPLAVDLILNCGAFMVLFSWGGILRYQARVELINNSAADLIAYCDQNGLERSWKMWSSLDAVWCVLLWLLLVGARVSLVLTRGEEAGALPSLVEPSTFGAKLILHLPGLQLFMYCISTSVLVVASFWQIRTSHAMLLIVNAWSAALLGGSIAGMQAKKQWRRVSGLFRKTSRAFELCFAALCAAIVFLTLSVLYDLRQGRGIEVLASIAVAFFIPGVLWTHASTTTACNRLPSLVMLCDAEDEEEDQQYMDLAMFLSLSECGFFAWDTCVTIGLVHKFLYFTVAVAGTIGFQTGAFNLQQITGS